MSHRNSIKNIRTGVIGVGSMGQNHARIYNDISTLVAVADPDEKQGRKLAERFGARWYPDYKEMLHEVDAVTIAVPTILHHKVAKSVAAAGIHMLVEKPLAGNVSESEKIIAQAKKESVILAVGHVERFNPVVRKANSIIDRGEWGDILTLTARRFSNYPPRIKDVGVLFDLTIHDVDVICSLVKSDVTSIFVAGGQTKNKGFEDYVTMVLGFENGMTGICETNWLTPMKVRELNLTTTDCHVNINYLQQEIEILSSEFGVVDESNLFQPQMKVKHQKIPVSNKEPLKEELMDFLLSVIEDRSPLVTGNDGLRAVKIVELGLKSLKSNSVIKI